MKKHVAGVIPLVNSPACQWVILLQRLDFMNPAHDAVLLTAFRFVCNTTTL
jgi:hypothetical protein